MASKHITILCYWNGMITYGSHGLGYEGASPKPVRISNRAKFSELVDKMYAITGFNRLLFEVKITCRFVRENTEINNSLRDEDDDEDTREGIIEEDACDITDQEEHMTYEEAAAPEFTKINLVSNVVVDVLAPSQKNTPQSGDDVELYAGQRFNTKDELQNAVKSYSIRVHQQYVVTNSSPNFWVLKCKQAPQCPWRLRASIRHGTSFFEIKKYSGPHTCVSPIINRDHVQLDSSFIANQIKALVKAQILITLLAIQAEISDKFNYDISKKKAWQAKQKAIVELFGDWLESYKLLPRYMDVLQRENPGWTEPQAYHRFCIRHLANNFNSHFHDKILKNLLWCVANENQVRKFKRRMETIRRINPEALKWLEDIPVQKWALAHDGGHRWDNDNKLIRSFQ
ncbi:hypothetical protein BUALT_Bualt05G0084900 [Buddleja alternifolia]|uniref:Transposase MuDR plant domain-containing protein n=1 Tax=Buddleja alternifolia TaxID=168488 RepID=A0AAV6XHL1_9LAMI|nr:hypothetical protein BUALT_Bualt05G0084900 [Buddleja alternifolia]